MFALIEQLHESEVDVPEWYTKKLEHLEELAEILKGPMPVLELVREACNYHQTMYPEDWNIMQEISLCCPKCSEDMNKIVPLIFQGNGVITYQCKDCRVVVHEDMS